MTKEVESMWLDEAKIFEDLAEKARIQAEKVAKAKEKAKAKAL